jgi:large subunit ribosomal protein L1
MGNVNKKSKRYKSLLKDLDSSKQYKISEAIKLIKERSKTKFIESIDLSFNLNMDKSKSDQTLRTTVDLPHGNGKKIKVAVICANDKIDEAKKSGADMVGSEDLIEIINNGKIDFDILVCTPDMMSKVGKLGKVLGPKGIMPNPKFGTVSPNIKKAVEDIKKGKVEIRCDKDGNLSLSVGRANFDDNKIIENYKSVLEVVEKEKPSGIKGNFINSIFLTSSMGPSTKISLASD